MAAVLEPVYQQALAVEFELREIPFYKEERIPIHYKGRLIEHRYSPDFICFDSIVVELKALARISGTEEAQVINYLKATGCEFYCSTSEIAVLNTDDLCFLNL